MIPFVVYLKISLESFHGDIIATWCAGSRCFLLRKALPVSLPGRGTCYGNPLPEFTALATWLVPGRFSAYLS